MKRRILAVKPRDGALIALGEITAGITSGLAQYTCRRITIDNEAFIAKALFIRLLRQPGGVVINDVENPPAVFVFVHEPVSVTTEVREGDVTAEKLSQGALGL